MFVFGNIDPHVVLINNTEKGYALFYLVYSAPCETALQCHKQDTDIDKWKNRIFPAPSCPSITTDFFS